MGSVLLATSLVADIQLIASATVWTIATYAYTLDREMTSVIISLSGGALLANVTSVLLYIGDTLKSKVLMMRNSSLWLILQRMRAPFLVIIFTYTISIIGLLIIDGGG